MDVQFSETASTCTVQFSLNRKVHQFKSLAQGTCFLDNLTLLSPQVHLRTALLTEIMTSAIIHYSKTGPYNIHAERC